MSRPGELKDGTPSYKDYTTSRNNRYQNPDSAQKNKPVAPANVLHWFNAPPGIDEQRVVDIFTKLGAKPPSKCKLFPKKCKLFNLKILAIKKKNNLKIKFILLKPKNALQVLPNGIISLIASKLYC